MLPGHLVGATGAGDVKLFAGRRHAARPGGHRSRVRVYGDLRAARWRSRWPLHRGRLHDTLQETATLVVTGGANVARIERPSAEQPVRVRAGDRARRARGGAWILIGGTTPSSRELIWLECGFSSCSHWPSPPAVCSRSARTTTSRAFRRRRCRSRPRRSWSPPPTSTSATKSPRTASA